MYLYHTVITGNEEEQLVPALSLGGFKSSSRVVNSKNGNLFPDISNMTITNYSQNQYIGLVLKNETGVARTNVEFWFEFPAKCYSNMKVAAVDMALDSNNFLQMEHVSNINEKPLNAEFFEANGSAAKVLIGDLAINEQVGIWIERSLLLDIIKEDQSNIWENDPDHGGRVREIPLGKEDEIFIGVSWN